MNRITLAVLQFKTTNIVVFDRFSQRLGGRLSWQPGEPTTDLGCVHRILATELALEMRFLVETDERVEADSNDYRIDGEARRLKQYGPGQDDREHSEVHGISGETVESSNNELLGGVDRSRGAPSKRGKVPHAPGVDCAAEAEKDERDGKSPTPGRTSFTRDEQGNENCDGSGRDDGEQQVLEEKHHPEDSRRLMALAHRRLRNAAE